jgi:allantoicase
MKLETILAAGKCLGDEEYDFSLNVSALTTPGRRPKLYTHVKISIIPDGAIKRFRILGQRLRQQYREIIQVWNILCSILSCLLT